MGEPHERVVLVTGANRGIGRAIGRRFLNAGFRVVATVRAADAEAEARRALGEADVVRCDVREHASVDALARHLRDRYGRLNIAINNAAVFETVDYAATADALDVEIVRRTLDVNVLGTIAVCVAVLPLMHSGAQIVNLSSDLGQFSKDGGMTPTMVAYSVSKAAVNAYTSALANAVSARGIRVDSVHPGWVKTAMGGPDAPLEPEDGAETVFALATRADGETGRFWIGGVPADW